MLPKYKVMVQSARRVVVLGTLLALPLLFDIRSLNVFELPKLTWFRVGTELALLLWLAELFFTYPSFTAWWKSAAAWLRRSPIDSAVVLLFVAAVGATACSIVPQVSWWGEPERGMGLFTLAHLALFYFFLRLTLSDRGVVRWLFKGLVVVVALVASYAIAQHFGIDLPGFRYGLRAVTPGFPLRAFSTLGHPNFLGIFLVMVLPLVLYTVFAAQSLKAQLGYVFCLALGSLAVLFTLSRSVWLAFALSLICFFVLAFTLSKNRLKLRRTLYLVAAAAVLGIVAYFVATPVADQAATWQRLVSIANLNGDTGGVRLWIWQVALDYLPGRPWLGYGPDTFYLLAQYHPSLFVFEPQAFDRVHNIFLDTTLSSGLAGLALFVLLLALVAKRVVGELRQAVSGEERLYYSALAASLVGYLAIGLFNFDTVVSSVYLYLLIALAVTPESTPQQPNLHPLQLSVARCVAFVVSVGVIGWLIAFNIFWGQADVYASRGERVQAAGNFSAAQGYFRKALHLNTYQPRYYTYLAKNLLLTAQSGGVSGNVSAALEQSLALYNQARVRGLPDTAYYQELLDLFTYWSTFDATELPTLLQVFEQAEPSLSNRSYFYRNWGIVLYETGDQAEARVKLKAYLRLYQGRPEPVVAPYLSRLGLP